MSKRKKHAQSRLGRAFEDVQFQALLGFVRVLAALPSRWVLRFADAVAWCLHAVDTRGRRTAHENLTAVFGDTLDHADRVRIVRASFRESVRSIVLLLHMQPMTAAKVRRFVDLPYDIEEDARLREMIERGAVLVSGHIGNWEILLGLHLVFRQVPKTVFVIESVSRGALNRLLVQMRSHGDLVAAMRKGGSRVVVKTVRDGGVAAMIVDRNVRGRHGGIYVPFLGIPARTTPLPAWLSTRGRVPIFPLLCLPKGDGRYRIWLGPDLSQNLAHLDANEQLSELTRRVNHVLSGVIRNRPEIWNWTLKRFKGRPTREFGPYPQYSGYDPDSADRRERAGG